MYAERTPPGTPPCGTCRVDLLEENEEAAEVYMTARRQYVTRGMEGRVVDIDFNALKVVMDLYGVRDQRRCFEAVRGVFHHFLREGQ